MPYLEIHDARGRRVEKLEGTLVIGREGGEADLGLAEKRCSRSHCRIERKGTSWRIVDLASSNGTNVNGGAVSQVVLADGDEIAIGETVLRFLMAAPHPTGADSAARPAGTPDAAPSRAAVAERRARQRRFTTVGLIGVALVALAIVFGSSPGGDEPDAVADRTESATPSPTDLPSPAVSAVPPVAPASATGSEPTSAEQERLAAVRASLAAVPLFEREEHLARAEEESASPAARAALATLRTAIRAEATAELERELRALAAASRQDVAAGRFAAALSRWQDLELAAAGVGVADVELGAKRGALEVLKAARDDWSQVRADAGALSTTRRFDDARRLLEGRVAQYRGTNFETLARIEMRVVELDEITPQAAVASGEAPAASAAPVAVASSAEARPRSPSARNDALDLVSEAERLAGERSWGEAAARYDRALALVEDESIARRWQSRSRLVSALASLKSAVVVAINEEDRRVRSVRIGRVSARPEAADDTTIQLKFGAAGLVTWKWKEIPQDRLIELFAFAAREPELKLALARVAFDAGDRQRAEAVLADVARKEDQRRAADLVFAELTGTPRPPGGFVVHDGTFLTPEEYALVQARLEAVKLADEMERTRPERFSAIVDALVAIGAPARAELERGLRARFARVTERFEELTVFKKPARYRAGLEVEIGERRKEALLLIRDTTRYPYPYAPNQAEVQNEVNNLVARVREIYETPSIWLLEKDKSVRETGEELNAIAKVMLDRIGVRLDIDALFAKLDQTLDMVTWSRSAADQRHNAEVATFNAEIKSSITSDERECHEATNVYRMMMGLRAVKIDEALVRGARSHSQEMKDLGYFAHDSPVPERKTPTMRARLAGWSGSCSENIARGAQTGKAAVEQWNQSSGHHRNILGSGWTHLGCGKASDGPFWTQNFASGGSSALSKEKIKPGENPAGDDGQEKEKK